MKHHLLLHCQRRLGEGHEASILAMTLLETFQGALTKALADNSGIREMKLETHMVRVLANARACPLGF